MIGGRTYRKALTTNDLKPTAPVEPEKLNQITTAIIPERTKDPAPEAKGDGFAKMITTHDEPKVRVEVDPNAGPGEAKYMDDTFKADTAEAAKKKAGRPKREK
jgi:hypothetical protein